MKRDNWKREKRTIIQEYYEQIQRDEVEPIRTEILKNILNSIRPDSEILYTGLKKENDLKVLNEFDLKINDIDRVCQQSENGEFSRFEEDKIYQAIICLDDLGTVFPEDWEVLMELFRKSLNYEGLMYLAVKREDENEIEEAYYMALEQELPMEYGEMGIKGYHFYPDVNFVRTVLEMTKFEIKEEHITENYYYFVASAIV